jgi:hypothetical protein
VRSLFIPNGLFDLLLTGLNLCCPYLLLITLNYGLRSGQLSTYGDFFKAPSERFTLNNER